tara:strand:+ start:13308 stop:14552 length:1245 start_codon:yes stop_codon:yes gene_type:complete
MALQLKIGTVMSIGDFTQTGIFKVAFRLTAGSEPVEEPVRYVSPYGNNKAAFVGIPPVGSQALCVYEDDTAGEGMAKGYYYLGSVMGLIPGANRSVPKDPNPPSTPPDTGYTDKTKPGIAGPDIPEGQAPMTLRKDQGPWPERFKDLYDGKGVVPEKVGFTTMRGDAVTIANRYKANKGNQPFQDHKVGLMSGSGKRLELVDSPIVDGIVMTNEHRGKDYLIWSTGMSAQSPFAEGEYHMRTHGPVNLYTLANRFHVWVEDGLNIEVENKSTGSKAYGDALGGPILNPLHGLGDPGNGGYQATRAGIYGNETTGCIQLWSHHNNISLSALEQDSVINIHTPGIHSRVIVDSAGTVDIIAKRKVTIQSDEEVEINAPIVDINGSTSTNVNGGTVYIDGGPNIFMNNSPSGGAYTA